MRTQVLSGLTISVALLTLLLAACWPAEAQNLTITGKGWSVTFWTPPLCGGSGWYSRRYCPSPGWGYNPGYRQDELRRQDKVLRAHERVLREREHVARAYAEWQALCHNPDRSSELSFIRWQRQVIAAERSLLWQQDNLKRAERALREASWNW
jgi:hypothetical protein